MIDIGVNLLNPQFDPDREAVLERARSAGITDMLITCTDLEMVADAIALCERFDLFCTAGLHPHDARSAPADLAARLLKLVRSSRVKAIGETGLDFNRKFSEPVVQRRAFETQLTAAEVCGLPVFVHDRDSDGAVFDMLKPHMCKLSGAVVHCFTGSARDLERYLSLGCYIGITGWICDERRGSELRELVRRVPLERLLIETDAPFLLPHSTPRDWHRRQAGGASRRRNEPALLPLVAARIAAELGISAPEVAGRTAANARALFRLPVRANAQK